MLCRRMGITRRDAIKRGGALAALLALGGPAAPAAAAGGPALSPRRQRVYRSLLTSLRGAAGGQFRHRDAEAATARFAAWYAAQDEAIRAHADAVLDHLDALGLRSATGRGRGLRSLRGWAGAKASPTAAESVHSAAVAAAVALAAQATAPPPDEDDAPVVPLLVGG
jgi:hypothetical protein